MEIRDPIYGPIKILNEEVTLIRSPFFQRLRNIKQLGFAEYIFPGATHTRFLHSIGVMNLAERAFNQLFKDRLPEKDFLRLKETFRLACLLHDIGHAPLSHSSEMAMPNLEELCLPEVLLSEEDKKNPKRQATHEDYTLKAICESSLSSHFDPLAKRFQIQREFIAEMIKGVNTDPSYFTVEGINYFPILHQLVSSEIDCDRMDYLLRDSYFCGVSYGNYDLNWLLDNLDVCIIDSTAYLGISERALITFDDFLLSRYHMFLMVYFHYRSVCLEQLLAKYFQTSNNEYIIPSNIEEYIDHDDYFLIKVLRNSKNPYARSIIENKIPQKIYESFNEDQLKNLEMAQDFLKKEGIEFIRSSSTGRLSKYYNQGEKARPEFDIFVVRKTNFGKTTYSNINEATDLFNKFSKAHAVNRLHCDLSKLTNSQQVTLQSLLNSPLKVVNKIVDGQ